ncbi:MAG: 50S ribosomal protein L10 [Gammaproteobacteria bacterium]|nr:50S ribosomal protein L10 [Gammaproteobacteria bacterium]
MALNLEDKKAIVTEMQDVLGRSVSAVAADYRGLTVSQMTQLRSNAREKNVHVRIYRNTLARRAVKETDFACLTEVLTGPIVLLLAQEEPGSAARLARDFMKEHENLEVRALALDGILLAANELKAVASLPSRDEAIAQLMSVMQAPITKLARTMAETYAQLVRVVAAVGDKKQAE